MEAVKSKDLFLKKISQALFSQDEIPLLRGDPLDLEKFGASLQQELKLKNLKIEFQNAAWGASREIFQVFGKELRQTCFSLTPLIGSFYLIAGKHELQDLILNVFQEKNPQDATLSPALKEGFWRYAILKVLKLLEKEKLFSGLNFKIIEEAELQSQNALFLDFQVSVNAKKYPVRLALTPDFRISWNQRQKSKGSLLFNAMQKNLQLPLSFILAKTVLKTEELQQIKPGDFLLLDKIYFNPKTDLDRIIVQLKSIPLFLAKLKKEKMQIIEFAYLEDADMQNQENKPQQAEKQTETPEKQEEVHKTSAEMSLNDLPLTVTVELCRTQMPLNEMTSLQPGNFIPIPSSIEEGVDLRVNDKKIARGELIHLGEKLGVRILEIE